MVRRRPRGEVPGWWTARSGASRRPQTRLPGPAPPALRGRARRRASPRAACADLRAARGSREACAACHSPESPRSRFLICLEHLESRRANPRIARLDGAPQDRHHLGHGQTLDLVEDEGLSLLVVELIEDPARKTA